MNHINDHHFLLSHPVPCPEKENVFQVFLFQTAMYLGSKYILTRILLHVATNFTFFVLRCLGLADLKGMCQRDTSCTLNKDTGLGTAFTLAHETAHK